MRFLFLFAWWLTGKKGLKPFYAILVLSIFFFHMPVYSHGCCLQCVRILEKSQHRKSWQIPVIQIFGKMAKKLARGAISKFCLEFLDIIVDYKRAKFGEARFGNGKAEFFFYFALAPIETSPIYIIIDQPKNTTSKVDMINSSTPANLDSLPVLDTA